MAQPDLQACYDKHYLSYVEYVERRGIKPMSFENWLKKHLGIKLG